MLTHFIGIHGGETINGVTQLRPLSFAASNCQINADQNQNGGRAPQSPALPFIERTTEAKSIRNQHCSKRQNPKRDDIQMPLQNEVQHMESYHEEANGNCRRAARAVCGDSG
jgi:hypothetical protein